MGQFTRRQVMILRAALGDFERAHDARQLARGGPVEPLHDAVQQTAAVSIATTGRIDHRFSFNGWDIAWFTVNIDGGTFRSQGDD